jgi:hypothetical protein
MVTPGSVLIAVMRVDDSGALPAAPLVLTGRLATEMFCEVVASVLARLHPAATAKQLA